MTTTEAIAKPYDAMKKAGREMVRAYQSGNWALYEEKRDLYRVERNKFCNPEAATK
jgi:hypothetical protein